MNDIRQIFENDYCGIDNFLTQVLSPIFGDYEKGYDVLTAGKDVKEKANQLNILEIKHSATFDFYGSELKVFDITVGDEKQLENNKVGVQSIVRQYIAQFEGALIIFHHANVKNQEWRLSYVEKRTTSKDSTSAKRYTYILGKKHPAKTVSDRFRYLLDRKDTLTLQDLTDAFSLEALTKDFYNELFDWYEWAITESKFPVGKGANVSLIPETETKGENIIRLVTRLMFVWFIKQKNLVPDWIFDSKEINGFLEDFDENSTTSGNYYNAILQNLFFATLNKDIKEREWAINDEPNCFKDYGVKTLYRDDIKKSFFKENKANELLERFKEVPFLNGGLFECLDSLETRPDGKNEQTYVDGFSRESKRRAYVPNALFFQLKQEKKEGLLHILKRYNFTIEENSPNDVEVALDPELLGKVFENLLGVFNPETSDTARHETGSFYTPREIVNYMVDQSLKDYIKTKVNEISQENLDALFEAENNLSISLSESICEKIKNALRTVKVLDPACGSGAFPMGVLNRIVDIYKLLSSENNLDSKTIYNFKKDIIENCIYGVDIQPIAVQISKLRFFISLICEQKKDKDEDNFGYYPLPNLETKFVAANTLIHLKRGTPSLFINNEVQDLKNKLHKIRENHFNAKTAKEKHKLREEDKECREKLVELLKADNVCSNEDAEQLSKWNPYNQKDHAEFFDPDWMYNMDIKPIPTQKTYEHKPNDLGFDIVIGNPPYIEEGKNSSAFDGFRENKRYYLGKMNIWYGFAQIGLDLLKDNGSLCFIAKNNWTTSSGAKLLRNQIINDSKILQILDFNSYMIFQSASIQTMIMMFKKDYTSNNYTFDYRSLGNEAKKNDMLDLLEKKQTEKTRYLTPTIKRSDFIDKFLVFSNTDYIFEKMKQGKVYLQESEIAQGIVPNPDVVNARNIKNLTDKSIKVGEGVFVVDKDKFSNVNPIEKKYIKPLYEPYQMDRYFLNSNNDKCLLYITKSNWKDDAPTLKKHLEKYKGIMEQRRENKNGRISFYHLHWPREEKYFTKGAKIISVRKCEKPIFVYYEPEAYVMMSVNIIKTDRWDLKYLTGVLNSTLIAFWLRNKGKMQGENYQVDKEPIMDIPLPSKPTKEQQDKIGKLVEEIISAKKANHDADTSKLESQIDILVYHLYGLSYEDAIVIDSTLNEKDFNTLEL